MAGDHSFIPDGNLCGKCEKIRPSDQQVWSCYPPFFVGCRYCFAKLPKAEQADIKKSWSSTNTGDQPATRESTLKNVVKLLLRLSDQVEKLQATIEASSHQVKGARKMEHVYSSLPADGGFGSGSVVERKPKPMEIPLLLLDPPTKEKEREMSGYYELLRKFWLRRCETTQGRRDEEVGRLLYPLELGLLVGSHLGEAFKDKATFETVKIKHNVNVWTMPDAVRVEIIENHAVAISDQLSQWYSQREDIGDHFGRFVEAWTHRPSDLIKAIQDKLCAPYTGGDRRRYGWQ